MSTMHRFHPTAALFSFSLLLGICSAAQATHYPPGPGGAFPDTLTIYNCQNPDATPHPVPPDTVYGIAGIITGLDTKPTSCGFYIQDSGGNPWTGIYVFTGSTNKGPGTPWDFQLGDSVVVYGSVLEYPWFSDETEIEGPDRNPGTDDIVCRRVSTGNPLPSFHVGTVQELHMWSSQAEQWEGMLVEVDGPLRVARLVTTNSFMLVDNTVPSPAESVYVNGATLTTYTPLPVGSIMQWVRGIYTQSYGSYRILLRDQDTDCPIACSAEGATTPAAAAQASGNPYWCVGLDAVTAEVNGSTVMIHHNNASYNCGVYYFEYSRRQYGDTILVHETMVLRPGCPWAMCECCFNLAYPIEDVPPGDYVIDFSWCNYGGPAQHQYLHVTVPDVGQLLAGKMSMAATSSIPPGPCIDEPPAGVGEHQEKLAFALYPAQPNPAAATTLIRYELPAAGPIRLAIFSVAGGRVRTLVQGMNEPGMHSVSWDGRNDAGQPAAGGVYFCRLEGREGVAKRTVILIR